MRVTKKPTRSVTAFAAAFVLLLNTLIVGLGDGAMATAEVTGNFSALICTAHGGATGPAAPDRHGQSPLPDCCTFGCPGATAHLATPPGPVVLAARSYERSTFSSPRYDAPLQRIERLQLNPRGPPAVA